MKTRILFIGLGLSLLIACQYNSSDSSTAVLPAEQLSHDAGKKVMEMEYDSAIVRLRQALEKGLERPMQIVTDSNFYKLIDSSTYRPEIRLLLEEFAVESHSAIVRSSEPGEAIFVLGQIVDESNNMTLSDVKVELVHTDRDGYYFREKTMWNPRLFAYLITDDKGEFSVSTILPGRYKDDDGIYVPAHIHFTLKKEGYRTYGAEFTFEDDPVFKANGNIEEVPVAYLQNTKGDNHYYVTIPMQKK